MLTQVIVYFRLATMLTKGGRAWAAEWPSRQHATNTLSDEATVLQVAGSKLLHLVRFTSPSAQAAVAPQQWT